MAVMLCNAFVFHELHVPANHAATHVDHGKRVDWFCICACMWFSSYSLGVLLGGLKAAGALL